MSSQFVRYEEGRRDDVENAGQEEDSRGQSPKLNRLLPKKDGLGEQRRDDVILWCWLATDPIEIMRWVWGTREQDYYGGYSVEEESPPWSRSLVQWSHPMISLGSMTNQQHNTTSTLLYPPCPSFFGRCLFRCGVCSTVILFFAGILRIVSLFFHVMYQLRAPWLLFF
jgi:hypothetical protein